MRAKTPKGWLPTGATAQEGPPRRGRLLSAERGEPAADHALRECAPPPALGLSNNNGPFAALNTLMKVHVARLGPGPALFIGGPKVGSRPGGQRVISFQTLGHWTSWIPPPPPLPTRVSWQDPHKINCLSPAAVPPAINSSHSGRRVLSETHTRLHHSTAQNPRVASRHT